MKKIYSFALVLLSCVVAQAQSNIAPAARKVQYQEFQNRNNNNTTSADRDILWSSDFSNAADWIIAHDGTFNSDFEIGTGLVSDGAYGTPAIESTTAANGYAMYNSDGFNNQAGVAYEQPHITTATPIDLSANPYVVLEFETQYRRFTDEQTYLIVSTDGTFPTLDDPTMDISGMPGVYKVWEDGELTTSISPGNPTVRSFNISEIAGSASQVWIRFQFTGIWGYAWYIDDAKIYEQYQHDANIFTSYVSSTGTGEEYARIPENQVPAEMNVGCYVKNLGYDTMTNVTVTIDMDGALSTYTLAELLPGDTMFVDDYVAAPSALGLHSVLYTVTSDQIATEGDTTNDDASRYYVVTPAEGIYSMDGLGVHPQGTEVISALGTDSFTDDADEIMLMTYYQLQEPAVLYTVRIELSSATVAGGEIIVQVHDTTDIFSNVIDAPLQNSDAYTVTETDVTNGYAVIDLLDPQPLDPNGYYVSAALYSNGNANDIRILDDLTVPQPGGASLIFLPSDGVVYSNGNSFAIQMNFDPNSVSVEDLEVTKLEGVNIYPNPVANGILTVATDQRENFSVEVFDSVGALVDSKRFNMNTTVDVSALAKGVYTVRVSSANASTTQLVTVQ
jgi:hypothetical protein